MSTLRWPCLTGALLMALAMGAAPVAAQSVLATWGLGVTWIHWTGGGVGSGRWDQGCSARAWSPGIRGPRWT